jgi:hypothetical protein
MYQNMGGGAEVTEAFKKFFAEFNLAENATHLGIVAAPFFAYSQLGSKMFENLHHTPANYLTYMADLTAAYARTIGGYFIGNSATTSPEILFPNNDEFQDQFGIEAKRFEPTIVTTQIQEGGKEKRATDLDLDSNTLFCLPSNSDLHFHGDKICTASHANPAIRRSGKIDKTKESEVPLTSSNLAQTTQLSQPLRSKTTNSTGLS